MLAEGTNFGKIIMEICNSRNGKFDGKHSAKEMVEKPNFHNGSQFWTVWAVMFFL